MQTNNQKMVAHYSEALEAGLKAWANGNGEGSLFAAMTASMQARGVIKAPLAQDDGDPHHIPVGA